MQFYRAYGLRVASEIPLSDLIVDPDQQAIPDVTIRIGTIDNTLKARFDGGQHFWGTMEGVGSFALSNGCEVIIEPVSRIDLDLLRITLLGPAFCTLLRQRGLLVLHASCVNINDHAVAFMGGQGWGKSTLATAFHTYGYNVLTDDVLAIQTSEKSCLAIPAYPQFKIWHEAAKALGHNADRLEPICQGASKLSYRMAEGFQKTPLPLHRIYVLARGEHHFITPITSQEAFVELVRHTRTIGLMNDPKFQSSHLHHCASLIQQVSFHKFIRKSSLVDLPNLLKMVVNDVTNLVDLPKSSQPNLVSSSH